MSTNILNFRELPNKLIDNTTLLLQFGSFWFNFKCLTIESSHILSITIENEISYFSLETLNVGFKKFVESIPNIIDISWLMTNFDVAMGLDSDYFPQFIQLSMNEVEVYKYSLSTLPPVLGNFHAEDKKANPQIKSKPIVLDEAVLQKKVDETIKSQEETKKFNQSNQSKYEPTTFKEVEFFPGSHDLNKEKKYQQMVAPKEIWDQVRLLDTTLPTDYKGFNPLPVYEGMDEEFDTRLDPSGIHQTDICKKVCCLCDFDNEQYIAGRTKGELLLMSKVTFTEIHKFKNNPHTSDIWSLIKINDEDGTWLLASSWDKTVSVWDLSTFECKGQYKDENWVYTTLHIRENIVASGGWDSRITYWNFKTFQIIHSIKYYGYVHQLVKYNRNVMVSVGWEGNIRFWDISSIKNSYEMNELRIKDENPITTVVIVNPEIGAVGTQVGQISIYNLQSKKQLKYVSCIENIQRLVFLSKTIFGACSIDHTVRIINVKKLVEEQILQYHYGNVNDMLRLNKYQILIGGLGLTRRWGQLPKIK